MKTSAIVIAALAPLYMSCMAPMGGYSPEYLNNGRANDQTYFEDSTAVFFGTYSNPFVEFDMVWFSVLLEGPVELHIHNTEADSVEAVYRFQRQETPLYTLACRHETNRLVKAVVYVNGRKKCAKMYTAWYPIEYRQWDTKYTVEEK